MIQEQGPHRRAAGEAEITSDSSFAEYETWATSVLLRPGDIRYYRNKFMEECQEFLAAETDAEVVEEAGDVIWASVTLRKLVTDTMGHDEDTTDFYDKSLKSLAGSGVWETDADYEKAVSSFGDMSYFMQRKAKLAVTWITPETSADVKCDYVVNPINDVTQCIVMKVAEITANKTGKSIDEIIAVNGAKVNARIASGKLSTHERSPEPSRHRKEELALWLHPALRNHI